MKFLGPIDLLKNELQEAKIANLSSDPSSPVTGQVYFNTTYNQLRFYNGTAWLIAAPSPWPTSYVYGANLTWNSTTGITVAPGFARDSSDFYNIVLGSSSTISTSSGSYGVSGGCDQITAGGTATFSATAVTGSGTTFKTSFLLKALNGTVSTSNTTTVAGTGTTFLSQVAVNDLVGNSTLGYVRVTAIASDTSLTTSAALNATGASYNCIEQPLLQIGINTVQRVVAIASDTALTLGGTPSGGSGNAVKVGGFYGGDASNNAFYHVFIGSNATGGATGVLLSCQRTSPYMPTYPYYRRVGSVMADSAGNLTNFTQRGRGVHRWHTHEFNNNTNLTRIASAVNPTSWTTYQGSAAAPPTAVALYISMYDSSASVVSLRPANNGGGSGSSANYVNLGGTGIAVEMSVRCDGVQQVQAIHTTSTVGGMYIDVGGFEDSL